MADALVSSKKIVAPCITGHPYLQVKPANTVDLKKFQNYSFYRAGATGSHGEPRKSDTLVSSNFSSKFRGSLY